MKVVSPENIERAIDEIEALSDEGFEALAQEFSEKQPALVAYLFVYEEEMSEDDFDLMANLAMTVYKAYSLECGSARMITPEEVENAAIAQSDALDELEDATEEEFADWVQKSFETCPQPVLMEFISHELHELEEDGAIDDESGSAVLYSVLRLCVELLHDAFNGARLQVV